MLNSERDALASAIFDAVEKSSQLEDKIDRGIVMMYTLREHGYYIAKRRTLKESIEAAIDASVDCIAGHGDDMASTVILSVLSARGYKIVKDDE